MNQIGLELGWTEVSFKYNLFNWQIGSSVLKEMHNMGALNAHPYNAFYLLIPPMSSNLLPAPQASTDW